MAEAASRRIRRRFGRLSIAAYLGLGIGGLMFLAVASILAITLFATWRNTTELLQDKSRLLLGSLVAQTERYLDPANAQAEFVAKLIERGELDGDDQDELLVTLRSVLAANPQVHGLAFFAAAGWRGLALRHEGGIRLGVASWKGILEQPSSWRKSRRTDRGQPTGAHRSMAAPARC
jgi:hypothetical protein